MKIIRARDYQHLSRQAANILSAQVILKPDSVLGLATGSSPIGTYQQLIAWEHKGDVDFRQVSTVNLDEYVGLPTGHPQSYAHFMRENFFDHIQIDLRNTHIPNGMAEDGDAAITTRPSASWAALISSCWDLGQMGTSASTSRKTCSKRTHTALR